MTARLAPSIDRTSPRFSHEWGLSLTNVRQVRNPGCYADAPSLEWHVVPLLCCARSKTKAVHAFPGPIALKRGTRSVLDHQQHPLEGLCLSSIRSKLR